MTCRVGTIGNSAFFAAESPCEATLHALGCAAAVPRNAGNATRLQAGAEQRLLDDLADETGLHLENQGICVARTIGKSKAQAAQEAAERLRACLATCRAARGTVLRHHDAALQTAYIMCTIMVGTANVAQPRSQLAVVKQGAMAAYMRVR